MKLCSLAPPLHRMTAFAANATFAATATAVVTFAAADANSDGLESRPRPLQAPPSTIGPQFQQVSVWVGAKAAFWEISKYGIAVNILV